MKAYVVNLESSKDRRKYMESILNNINNIEVEFVSAVDGRLLSEQEINEHFNCDKYKNDNFKLIRPGEVGCTLSHQKCYRKLLNSDYDSVIIFEDDLIVNYDVERILSLIEEWLSCEEPRVLLLSGWNWYTGYKKITSEIRLTNVIDGLLTHAYALNKAAAKLMIDTKPWYVADAWEMFRRRGVTIGGISPHPFDQDWSGVFETTVSNQECQRIKIPFNKLIHRKIKSLRNIVLKLLGLYEYPKKE